MKLRKAPEDNKVFYINCTALLGADETLTSIDSFTITPNDLAITDEQINSAVIDETIAIGKAVKLTISGGLDGYEYVLEFVLNTSKGQIIRTDVVLLVTNGTQIPVDYYGNLLRASQYFKNRLDAYAWDYAINPRQRIALFEATQLIDNLNYLGSKTDASQLLEFPRNGDSEIPRNIEFATYELAYELLDGVLVNKEIDKVAVTSQSYAGVRTTYDRSQNHPHILAGIPSAKAWNLLQPYLRDMRNVTLCRVN